MTYRGFAQVYDVLMEHAPYNKWVDFTEEIIKNHHIQIEKVLDLGCGTGEITIRLAEKGYDISGVDLSADMLSQAATKSIEEQIDITWVHQDIRQLAGFTNLDLCISYCDVVNYITEKEDIKIAFQKVYESLREDGLFIFDVHSFQYVQNELTEQTFAEVNDELTYIWECESGDEAGEMYHYITFFQRDGMLYDRFDEVHHQKTYPVKMYETLLEQTGFREIKVYQDFDSYHRKPEHEAERIFIVAQK